MDINQAFPSRYIKASDLNGQDCAVVIERILMEDLGGKGRKEDTRPVVYFVGKKKGLALNKTNANTIAQLHGYETDGWCGKSITIYPTETEYKEEVVACIRVRMQAPVSVQDYVTVKSCEVTF